MKKAGTMSNRRAVREETRKAIAQARAKRVHERSTRTGSRYGYMSA